MKQPLSIHVFTTLSSLYKWLLITIIIRLLLPGGHVSSCSCLYQTTHGRFKRKAIKPKPLVTGRTLFCGSGTYERLRPGHELSEGQGVAVGQGGWTEDHASVLGVCLQHALGLLPSHIEEAPAGTRQRKT